jgi:hypothetical protein
MRERGKYQIQCMKSRSSTGVGQKIDLEYNIETMRITDEDPDSSVKEQQSANQIMSQIKPFSKVFPTNDLVQETLEDPSRRTQGDAQSSKLKAMLNSLKK